MKKMRCPNTTILTVCFVLLTLSAQMTLALSLRLSKILQQNDQTREAQELKEPQQNWFVFFFPFSFFKQLSNALYMIYWFRLDTCILVNDLLYILLHLITSTFIRQFMTHL